MNFAVFRLLGLWASLESFVLGHWIERCEPNTGIMRTHRFRKGKEGNIYIIFMNLWIYHCTSLLWFWFWRFVEPRVWCRETETTDPFHTKLVLQLYNRPFSINLLTNLLPTQLPFTPRTSWQQTFNDSNLWHQTTLHTKHLLHQSLAQLAQRNSLQQRPTTPQHNLPLKPFAPTNPFHTRNLTGSSKDTRPGSSNR